MATEIIEKNKSTDIAILVLELYPLLSYILQHHENTPQQDLYLSNNVCMMHSN